MDDRILKAKRILFVAINNLDYGGSPMDVVEAIDELVLAIVSDCFRTHPVTRDKAGEKP